MARSVGRPTSYKKRYCQDIIEFAKEGKLPIIWSRELMVAQSTFTLWRNKHPEFMSAWQIAKDIAQAHMTDIGVEADNAVDLAKAKFFLSAAFGVSETQKIESKQDVTAKVETVEVSFGDRED